MPRRSATIIENDVAWPWPCADVPDITVAEPSSWICTEPNSEPPKPVISTYVAMPMPSSFVSPASIAAPLLRAGRVDVGDPQRLLERELVVADVVGLTPVCVW